jgi:magnesium-transporting ATPase (P-type)
MRVRKLKDSLWDLHIVLVESAAYAIFGIISMLVAGGAAVWFMVEFWASFDELEAMHPQGQIPGEYLAFIATVGVVWVFLMLLLFVLLVWFIRIVWRRYRS